MSEYAKFMKERFPRLDYDNQVRYQERLGILMDSSSEDVPDEAHRLALKEIVKPQRKHFLPKSIGE